MEHYWELRSKNAQNIKALMCPLYQHGQPLGSRGWQIAVCCSDEAHRDKVAGASATPVGGRVLPQPHVKGRDSTVKLNDEEEAATNPKARQESSLPSNDDSLGNDCRNSLLWFENILLPRDVFVFATVTSNWLQLRSDSYVHAHFPSRRCHVHINNPSMHSVKPPVFGR